MVLASLCHGNICLARLRKNRRKEEKKINRLAIRLIWCYSPDNMFKYIWAHQSYQANQEFSEISHGFFSFQWLLCLLSLCRAAHEEKINMRSFNNSLIIAQTIRTTQIDRALSNNTLLSKRLHLQREPFVDVFTISSSSLSETLFRSIADANLTWLIAIFWHWIVVLKSWRHLFIKRCSMFTYLKRRCDIWTVITKIYFSR